MRQHPERWKCSVPYRITNDEERVEVWVANGIWGMHVSVGPRTYGGVMVSPHVWYPWGYYNWRYRIIESTLNELSGHTYIYTYTTGGVEKMTRNEAIENIAQKTELKRLRKLIR